MREIKFRGFDLDDKKWYFGGYHKHIKRQVCPINDELRTDDVQHCIFVDGSADWNMPKGIKFASSIDEKSIGQYTGLKDKNDKEIYEGDVVKYEHWHCDFTADCGNGCIKYEKGCYWIQSNKGLTYELKSMHYTEIEVIGNVYENPELLEEDKL